MCANCGEAVEETASFCPRCGHPGGGCGGTPQPEVAGRPAGGRRDGDLMLMLITANVLRLRRQWALAEAKCSEALQRDPDNAAAYSVMGDIVRDQGNLRDAIEWYKMALDRNPASAPDRRKLEALIDEVFGSPRGGVLARGLAVTKRALSGTAADVSSARPPAALALVVGGLLVVILAVALSAIFLGRRWGVQPASATTEAGSGAFVVPASAPGAAAKALVPAGRPAPPVLQPTGSTGKAAEALAQLEPELRDYLSREARQFDPNCQVLGVEVDPRDAGLLLRISMPRLAAVASTRDSALRVVAALTRSALAWDDRVSRVRVRCDLRQPEQPDAPGMVADGTREQLSRLGGPRDMSAAEIERSLAPIWWAAELRGQ